MVGIQNIVSAPFQFSVQDPWLDAAWDVAPMASLIVDADGRVQWANRKARTTIAPEGATLVGESIDNLVAVWDGGLSNTQKWDWKSLRDSGVTSSVTEIIALQVGARRFTVELTPLDGKDACMMGMLLSFYPVGTRTASASTQAPAEVTASTPAESCKHRAVYVRTAGKYLRVLLDDLMWVEAMENYVQLQMTTDKLMVHATLKSMDDALAGKGFQRIHRSFIAKKDEIERIEENHVVINGTALPIGKSYRAVLLDSLVLI
jgi:hypothetical protein